MFARHATYALALSATLGVSARATAQAIEVVVREARKITASHGEDPSAAGTSLDLTDRITQPRSLADALRETPGAQVTSSGGLGAFSSLSLRGAGSEETLVLIDEIPLSSADGAAFDLSLFPAELFAKLQTFRGGAPVWLGGGAIGGVLQLVPRRGRQNAASLSLGAGSFGSYQLGGGAELSTDEGLTSQAQLVVRGTQGDYPYVHDGTTRFDASDDHEARLRNADFREASGLYDLTVPLWGGTLHLLALGLLRGGGFPGSAAAPALQVRRESTRALTALSYLRERGDASSHGRRLQLVGSGAYGADRVNDLAGELGTSKQTASDNRSFRAFLRAAGSLHLTRWLVSTVVASYAYDTYLPFDAVGSALPQFRRHSAATALELAAQGSLGKVRFELRPSARLEWSQSEQAGTGGPLPRPAMHDQRLVPTARLGAAIEPVRGVALSAHVATGMRLPAAFELFGDGLLVLPNRALKPVRSLTYDVGLTVRGRRRRLRGSAELHGFFQERRDLIGPEQNARREIQFENFPSVQQWGAETRLTGALTQYAELSYALTWLETETALGKRLPFRSRFVGYVGPALRIPLSRDRATSLRVGGELRHRSFAFSDSPNLAYTDACTTLGVGAQLSLFRDRVRVGTRLDDAFDARCTDLLGYPLPGRSLLFSLSLREDQDDDS